MVTFTVGTPPATSAPLSQWLPGLQGSGLAGNHAVPVRFPLSFLISAEPHGQLNPAGSGSRWAGSDQLTDSDQTSFLLEIISAHIIHFNNPPHSVISCDLYLLIFTTLACISCKASSAAETMCMEITVNKSYICEGLGLREIPDELPATTEILDFSFSVIPSLRIQPSLC
ncbi:CD180 molecule [Columba livia]|uniref:CD180 molecule n=1 Tax=Columba livia TaxID=8932 RepID=A0A2I0M176_COLLI|nr:CD180 molecule [Columba livia]